MMKYLFSFLIGLIVVSNECIAQKKKFDVEGYVEAMQIVSFVDNPDSVSAGNFLSNRLNFNYSSKNLNASVGVRNRIFWGEIVKDNPDFAELLDENDELLDLSFNVVDENSVVANVNIDRLWMSFKEKQFEAKLGRQRINWGINLIWNPNDLFNTYNFLNFDYAERPGTDAVRLQFYTGLFSYLDLSVKPGKTKSQNITALRYSFNSSGYDFQIFGGLYNEDLTIGAGWAGNIGEAGFKGEVTYFYPSENSDQSNEAVSLSTSVDGSFSNGIYLNGSFLLCSNANNDINNFLNLSVQTLTPKNLMPAKYSFLGEVMYAFDPLLTGTMSVTYCPVVNALIVYPYLSYSVQTNWDIDLIGQTLWGNANNKFRVIGNTLFMRIIFHF